MTSGVGAEREMAETPCSSDRDSVVPMLRGCLSIVRGPRRGFDAPVWLRGAVCGGARRLRWGAGGRYSGGVEQCSQQSKKRCCCWREFGARSCLSVLCVCVQSVGDGVNTSEPRD